MPSTLSENNIFPDTDKRKYKRFQRSIALYFLLFRDIDLSIKDGTEDLAYIRLHSS
jgi:hypothetical protein